MDSESSLLLASTSASRSFSIEIDKELIFSVDNFSALVSIILTFLILITLFSQTALISKKKNSDDNSTENQLETAEVNDVENIKGNNTRRFYTLLLILQGLMLALFSSQS